MGVCWTNKVDPRGKNKKKIPIRWSEKVWQGSLILKYEFQGNVPLWVKEIDKVDHTMNFLNI